MKFALKLILIDINEIGFTYFNVIDEQIIKFFYDVWKWKQKQNIYLFIFAMLDTKHQLLNLLLYNDSIK